MDSIYSSLINGRFRLLQVFVSILVEHHLKYRTRHQIIVLVFTDKPYYHGKTFSTIHYPVYQLSHQIFMLWSCRCFSSRYGQYGELEIEICFSSLTCDLLYCTTYFAVGHTELYVLLITRYRSSSFMYGTIHWHRNRTVSLNTKISNWNG